MQHMQELALWEWKQTVLSKQILTKALKLQNSFQKLIPPCNLFASRVQDL